MREMLQKESMSGLAPWGKYEKYGVIGWVRGIKCLFWSVQGKGT
jgi:hypothetical protein